MIVAHLENPPAYAVERSSVEPPQWSVFVIDLAGGIGPRAAAPFRTRHQAEAWAIANGQLADPCLEAA
jgi:hypothetical protein